VRQLAWWLRKYPTVTLLSFERVRGGDEEEHARSQRRILRDWLLRRPLSV
jgi:hypothetical protein